MWTDLSIKDKSDLMRIFLNNGVSSLSDMRRIYDGEQDTPANDTTKVENINRYNNPTLLKYAGTNVEPIIRDYMYFAETPQKAAKFLADRNITENRDVVDYFNSYVNSEGYKRIQQNQSNWWKQRHPYRKYIDLGLHKEGANELRNTVNKVDKTKAIRAFNLDTYSNLSFFVPNSGNAYIGNIPTTSRYPNVTYSFEPTYVTGHEVAHRYNGNLETLMGAQREALQYKINTKITGDKDIDERHDNYLDEIHSDVWGLKYLLFKEGIYDSRSNKDITIEEIKKLREKYPNLRPLMQSTDEELVWRLNHIASLDKKINTENLAAFGGRIYDGLSNTKSYKDWKEKIKKYKNIDIDNDKSYDYIGFYNENPERAYRLLKENSDTHFTDKYKTPLHATFSDESIYSNNRTKGGHWVKHPNNKWEFQHSDYTAEHLEDTNRYLQENDINSYATYKNGVVLTPAIITDSKKRIYNGIQDTDNYQLSLDNYSKYKNSHTFTTEDLNVKPAPINYNEIALRQRYAESTFNNEAVSPKGAVGAYGIMPKTHKWYVDETGDEGDLKDPKYNKKIRDWLIEKNLKSDIHSPMDTDSVRVGKSLVQYNLGAGNTRKRLIELESRGIDTHNSFEWLDYFPKEPVDYVNFTLRNKDVNEHKSEKSYQKAKRKLKIK